MNEKNSSKIKLHQLYMRRCFDIARLGAGTVSPNPMVGALLLADGRIIGEGWHEQYGQAHAEVNAVHNVAAADRHLIEKATLYVSLEPCCIHGKTPPCSQLILDHNIPKVVVSCLDQTPGVAGQSVDLLRAAGVEVVTGVLEKEGKQLSAIRNTYVSQKRPFIVLKYAQSADGFMGKEDEQVWLSNPLTKRLAHKWRSAFDAILIGTRTAEIDDPKLNNRLYFGGSPLRVVIDKNLRLSPDLNVMDDSIPTLILTQKSVSVEGYDKTHFIQLPFDEQPLNALMDLFFEWKITSVMIEGGAKTLQHFIDQNYWDEAYVFQTNKRLHQGVTAPKIGGKVSDRHPILNDVLLRISNQ